MLRGISALVHRGRVSGLFWGVETEGGLWQREVADTGKACRQRESLMQTHDTFSEAQDDEKKR